MLRTTAVQEVEALLHDARKRAQALADEATERHAAALAEAEAAKSRLQLEAERDMAEATERAASLITEAREEELAIRKEIDRLTQRHLQLVEHMRATLNTCHEWLNDNGLSFHVPKIAQPLTERVDTAGDSGSRPAAKESYPGGLPRLLRLDAMQRKRDAESEHKDEPDQPHAYLG